MLWGGQRCQAQPCLGHWRGTEHRDSGRLIMGYVFVIKLKPSCWSIQHLSASIAPLALPRRLSFVLQLFEFWSKEEPPGKAQDDADDGLHVVPVQGGHTGAPSCCAQLKQSTGKALSTQHCTAGSLLLGRTKQSSLLFVVSYALCHRGF